MADEWGQGRSPWWVAGAKPLTGLDGVQWGLNLRKP